MPSRSVPDISVPAISSRPGDTPAAAAAFCVAGLARENVSSNRASIRIHTTSASASTAAVPISRPMRKPPSAM